MSLEKSMSTCLANDPTRMLSTWLSRLVWISRGTFDRDAANDRALNLPELVGKTAAISGVAAASQAATDCNETQSRVGEYSNTSSTSLRDGNLPHSILSCAWSLCAK